ncbi:MAG: SAM-dependent methyltransferase [Frankiales bacterium]|nr:SAM-dependent methyltransferase [Frankiales bacterium]
MTDLQHLNELFAASEDPWHTRSGWYSERKRELLLASLPNARYSSTFEPGCRGGDLTLSLASRSDRVLAVDARREAVSQAAQRTAHLSNVDVQRRYLPEEWPANERFDLIVLHEIGLGFDPANWAGLAAAIRDSLSADATVLACHWKHEFAERNLDTHTLHNLLNTIMGLPRQTTISDSDFTLDVWTTRQRTVAGLDGAYRLA